LVAAGSCALLRCRPIFLLRPAHHDRERVVRQRPLRSLRLIPRRPHPHIALLVGRQDHRHRLRMDGCYDRVRRRRQEAIDLMRPRDRLGLRAAVAVEGRPDARKCERGAVLIERKPDHVLLLGLGLGFGAYSAKLSGILGLTDDPTELDGCPDRGWLCFDRGPTEVRWLAILIATFIALSALAELHYGDFAPGPTKPMPAVNLP
jgi:hypothetical protein